VVRVVATLVAATLFLLLTWLVSGDLQGITVLASLLLFAVLAVPLLLVRRGRVRAALWFLVGLLAFLVTADVVAYGVATPAPAAFVLPVLLAGCGLGLGPGLTVAALGSGVVWAVAWAASTGRLSPGEPFEAFHLTFNAPVVTVLLALTALIAGTWGEYVKHALSKWRNT
jgi:hypothetical protein